MIEFLLGAAATAVASKKLKNKSKDEIKEMLNSGLTTIGKVATAGVELAVDKINDAIITPEKKQKETKITDKDIEKIKDEEIKIEGLKFND